MSLKVYYDYMSQPSRAVLIFLKVNDIPYIDKETRIQKGDHMTEEYSLLVNPFKKVPAIVDGHFRLTESVAILKYLCDKHNVADHWYPKDLRARARVDEFMAWQHHNTRYACASLVWARLFTPNLTGQPVNEEKVAFWKKEVEKMLDHLENIWLKTTPYIAGVDISLADILALCELQMLLLIGYDVTKDRPVLTAWANRVKSKLQPHLDEVNRVLVKSSDNFVMRQAKL